MIGETVSRYRIEPSSAAAGWGSSTARDDTRLGRDVALKFLPPRLSADPGALARFEREARPPPRSTTRTSASSTTSSEHDGRPFIVMELLRGADASSSA